MISIITPCANQANLSRLHDTIKFDQIQTWIIVYDTSSGKTFEHKYADNPKIQEVECSNVGVAGNPQRNYGMSLVTEGFMYFLNMETIIHPNFWSIIKSLNPARFYTFDQFFFKRDAYRTTGDSIFKGDVIEVFKIDGGMFLVPKSLVGESMWAVDKYTGDGLFISDIHTRHPELHTYIPQVGCYYNFISDSQPNVSTDGGLQNVFFLSRVAPPYYPVIDKHYTWIPVHGAISFERLSGLYHKYKPLAYISHGDNDWHALSHLASIRKRWIHLKDLPTELDVCPVIFGAMFPGRHSIDNNFPLMTIMTTAFNSGHKILRPLRSLKAQSHTDWEWIIWDDSKNDKTFKELLKLQETDMRIRVYKAPAHSGYIGEMKKLASSLAQGSYIVEIDHDDDFHPDLLKWICDAGRKHPDAGFFYTDCAELDENTYKPAIYGEFFGLGYEMHMYTWSAFHNCYVARTNAAPPNAVTLSHIVAVPNHVRAWRTDAYHRMGGHNPLLSVADDYELILRSFLDGQFCHIRALGYYQYRNADGNFTFIRNSLIQHNVHHIYDYYKTKLPVRDFSVPIKEQWRTDSVWLPETHYTYTPPEFVLDVAVAFLTADRDAIVAEVSKQLETGRKFHVYVVGELPDIPQEMKRYVSWWPLKSTDPAERKTFVEKFMHTTGELVFV